ncbi:methionyl-tRNA formyltransferase [Lyngbya confervoides]|uniref:Methionyl-tRNA formyltransferase n=1 Tax=Lyngbya confervoides BDU141951 TaxID=1574623 RepID=A0ABD4SYZ8_9CYAN|nr:methionyl-tRNA formyltransferase [Lyngbya confervoides]MCM1981325.1 methionyl-tRNA formyltransferase [Lyngbya confervoides BDU141951]
MARPCKLVFWGTPQFAVPSLRYLLNADAVEVVGVVTQPDRRRGRGQQISPSPVKVIAQAAEVPLWQPERVKKDPQTLRALQNLQADAFVVVAYGQILSPEILSMPRLGCINSHASLLPKYRGAAPIQWAIYHGESQTGVTTMLMDAGMDTGAMLLRSTWPIGLLDNAQDLAQALAVQSGPLLADTLQQLDQGILEPQPQSESLATYAPLLHKPDFCLDWHRPALALHNQVRAFFPNALATFRHQTIKVLETWPLAEDWADQLPEEGRSLLAALPSAQGKPGEVVQVVKGQGPIVGTADGYLLIRGVQLAGKRPQSGWDFANGSRVGPEDILTNGG